VLPTIWRGLCARPQCGTDTFPRISSVLEGNSSATVQRALLSFDFYASAAHLIGRRKHYVFGLSARLCVRACMHTCVRKRQYQIGLQLTSSSCNRLCNQIISTITVIMMTMKVVFWHLRSNLVGGICNLAFNFSSCSIWGVFCTSGFQFFFCPKIRIL